MPRRKIIRSPEEQEKYLQNKRKKRALEERLRWAKLRRTAVADPQAKALLRHKLELKAKYNRLRREKMQSKEKLTPEEEAWRRRELAKRAEYARRCRIKAKSKKEDDETLDKNCPQPSRVLLIFYKVPPKTDEYNSGNFDIEHVDINGKDAEIESKTVKLEPTEADPLAIGQEEIKTEVHSERIKTEVLDFRLEEINTEHQEIEAESLKLKIKTEPVDN